MAKEPLSKEERQKLLESRLKSIGSLDKIVKGEDFDTRHKDFISLGIPEIETEMGDLPGFATGNLIELIGESGSGKTYVALKTAAQAQKKGMKVAFFNVENSFYETRANQIGVITRDPSLFEMVPNLGSGEDVCDTVCAMVESELYGLIIIDSVTALIPNDSLSKGFNDPRKIGEHARLVGELAKKLTYLTGEHNTSVILINQFRFGSGAMPNTFVKKATGGEGLFFYDHYRFSFKKIGGAPGAIYNSEKQVIGGKTELTMTKIRYATPNAKVIFPIYFTEEDSNPVIDFLMRAKARHVELIKEVGSKNKKRYQYITEDGEIIESADVKEFINLLMITPAPSNRTKNDKSNTAFEFICRKIKFDEKTVNEMIKKLEQDEKFETPNELIGYAEEPEIDESSD
jgi:RecA/RadA recombinase